MFAPKGRFQKKKKLGPHICQICRQGSAHLRRRPAWRRAAAAARQNAQFFVRGQPQMIFCWKNQSSCQRRSLSSSSGQESLPAEGRRCVRPIAATRWRQVARLLASLARSSGTARTSLASPQRSRDQLFTRKSTAPRRPPLPNQTSAYSAYHCCFGQFKLWPCKAQTDARK